jgi:hypothetical protein
MQMALGNSSVSQTEEAKTTEGGSISEGFANVLTDIIKAVTRFIPGNGDTVINVNTEEE